MLFKCNIFEWCFVRCIMSLRNVLLCWSRCLFGHSAVKYFMFYTPSKRDHNTSILKSCCIVFMSLKHWTLTWELSPGFKLIQLPIKLVFSYLKIVWWISISPAYENKTLNPLKIYLHISIHNYNTSVYITFNI